MSYTANAVSSFNHSTFQNDPDKEPDWSEIWTRKYQKNLFSVDKKQKEYSDVIRKFTGTLHRHPKFASPKEVRAFIKQVPDGEQTCYREALKIFYKQTVPVSELYNAISPLLIRDVAKIEKSYSDSKEKATSSNNPNIPPVVPVFNKDHRTFIQKDVQESESTPENVKKRTDTSRALSEMTRLLKLKRYSRSTIKNYSHHVKLLLDFTATTAEQISESDITEYLMHCITVENRSASFQKQAIVAIRYFLTVVLHRQIETDATIWPKDKNALPVVFSQEEVARILASVSNLKHKAILYIIYSGGLRRGEIPKLTVEDIDFDRKLIHIRGAKGRKDRYTLLSKTAAKVIQRYLAQYNPIKRLFPGQTGGEYSTNSIQMIFRKALLESGVKKDATPHTLRYPNLNKIQTFFKRT